MSEHEPAPWFLEPQGNQHGGDILICDGNGHGIATVWCDGQEPRQDEANLIAAAPELLEALCIAEVHLGWTDCTLENVHHLCRNAIAKAKGTNR